MQSVQFWLFFSTQILVYDVVFLCRHSVPGVMRDGKLAQLVVLYELPRLVVYRFSLY